MQRLPRRATLGLKGLLALAGLSSAILLAGTSFFASGNARTKMNDENHKVLVGAAAFGDWHSDAPGLRRLITAQDLPEIGKDVQDYAEIVPRPAGAMPLVPEGFSVELVVSGLAQARVIRVAPNGDLFVTNSSANEVRIYRIPPGSSKPAITEVFATGLHQPYGMAFYPPGPIPQWIYIANSNGVVRFPYKNGDLKATAKSERIVEGVPPTHHWTRDILFTSDGKRLLLTVASGSNIALDMFPVPRVPGGLDGWNKVSFRQVWMKSAKAVGIVGCPLRSGWGMAHENQHDIRSRQSI